MYASIENLWSVLFTTGYLTQTGRKDANTFMLTIPNMEIRNIFLTQIMEYFKKTVSENGEALEKFCNALKDGNSEVVEQSLNNYGENEVEYGIGTLVLKPYETVVFQLH